MPLHPDRKMRLRIKLNRLNHSIRRRNSSHSQSISRLFHCLVMARVDQRFCPLFEWNQPRKPRPWHDLNRVRILNRAPRAVVHTGRKMLNK
jgi:hypothetical protein